MQSPSVEELTNRINRDIDHFDGCLPERFAIAWRGYLAALLEWQLISVSNHDQLSDLLPQLEEPDPVVAIMLGRDHEEQPEKT